MSAFNLPPGVRMSDIDPGDPIDDVVDKAYSMTRREIADFLASREIEFEDSLSLADLREFLIDTVSDGKIEVEAIL